MKGLNWLTLILAAQEESVSQAAGSALLSDIDQIQRIVGAVASSVDVPVSIKTRIGLTLDDSEGTRAAIAAQNAGAQTDCYARSQPSLSLQGSSSTPSFARSQAAYRRARLLTAM